MHLTFAPWKESFLCKHVFLVLPYPWSQDILVFICWATMIACSYSPLGPGTLSTETHITLGMWVSMLQESLGPRLHEYRNTHPCKRLLSEFLNFFLYCPYFPLFSLIYPLMTLPIQTMDMFC